MKSRTSSRRQINLIQRQINRNNILINSFPNIGIHLYFQKDLNIKKNTTPKNKNSKTRRIISSSHSLPKKKVISNHNYFSKTQKDLKFQEEKLKSDNNLFNYLYNITKNLYPRNIEKTFEDLITKYDEKKYIIPELSDEKNLFNPNPLLLVGRDLDNYYLYHSKKGKIFVNDKKHTEFLRKERLCLENTVQQHYDIEKNKENNNHNLILNKMISDSIHDKIMRHKKFLLSKNLFKRANNNVNTFNKKIENFNNANGLNLSQSDKSLSQANNYLLKRKKIFRNSNIAKKMKKKIKLLKNDIKTSQKTIESMNCSNSSHQIINSYSVRKKNTRSLDVRKTRNNISYKKENFYTKTGDLLIKKLLLERNHSKFVDMLFNINIELLNKRQIETIIKIYYKNFYGYNDEQIEETFLNDPSSKDIFKIVNDLVNRTKKPKKFYELFKKKKKKMENIDSEVYNFRKKFIEKKSYMLFE